MDDPKRNWLGPYVPQGNVLRDVFQQVKLAFNLMLDPRVSVVTKLIPLAAVAYLISPIDLVPDILFPIVGEVDDIFVLIFGLRMFFEFSPSEVVSEHLSKLVARVKGDWSVVDNPAAPPPAAPPAGGEIVDNEPLP